MSNHENETPYQELSRLRSSVNQAHWPWIIGLYLFMIVLSGTNRQVISYGIVVMVLLTVIYESRVYAYNRAVSRHAPTRTSEAQQED